MRRPTTLMPSPFDVALEDIDPQIVKQAEHDADTRVALIAALREERIERGMSQTDVADELDLAQSAISEFENGNTDPRLSMIQRYARAVDASITVLFDHVDVRHTLHSWNQPNQKGVTALRTETRMDWGQNDHQKGFTQWRNVAQS